jgi:hypothetical protein
MQEQHLRLCAQCQRVRHARGHLHAVQPHIHAAAGHMAQNHRMAMPPCQGGGQHGLTRCPRKQCEVRPLGAIRLQDRRPRPGHRMHKGNRLAVAVICPLPPIRPRPYQVTRPGSPRAQLQGRMRQPPIGVQTRPVIHDSRIRCPHRTQIPVHPRYRHGCGRRGISGNMIGQ